MNPSSSRQLDQLPPIAESIEERLQRHPELKAKIEALLRNFPGNNYPNFDREGGFAALSIKIGVVLFLEVPNTATRLPNSADQ